MKKYEVKYWFMVQMGPFHSPKCLKTEPIEAWNRQHAYNIGNDKLIELKKTCPSLTHITVKKLDKINAAIAK